MLYRVRIFIFVSLFCVTALANDPFKKAEEGKWDEVYAMFDAGTAHINQRNAAGESFFDVAVRLNDVEAVTELVTRGIALQDLEDEPLEVEPLEAEQVEFVDAVLVEAVPLDSPESPEWPRRMRTPAGQRPPAQRGLVFIDEGEPALRNPVFDCSFAASPISASK